MAPPSITPSRGRIGFSTHCTAYNYIPSCEELSSAHATSRMIPIAAGHTQPRSKSSSSMIWLPSTAGCLTPFQESQTTSPRSCPLLTTSWRRVSRMLLETRAASRCILTLQRSGQRGTGASSQFPEQYLILPPNHASLSRASLKSLLSSSACRYGKLEPWKVGSADLASEGESNFKTTEKRGAQVSPPICHICARAVHRVSWR